MREGNNAQVTDDKRKIRLILWTVKGEEAKCSRTLRREKPPYKITSIRRLVLFSEQVAVCSGTGQGQHQHFFFDAVD